MLRSSTERILVIVLLLVCTFEMVIPVSGEVVVPITHLPIPTGCKEPVVWNLVVSYDTANADHHAPLRVTLNANLLQGSSTYPYLEAKTDVAYDVWYVGSEQVGQGNSLPYTFTAPGTYTVYYWIRDLCLQAYNSPDSTIVVNQGTASLTVNSNPSGASATLEARPGTPPEAHSGITPARFSSIIPGSYTLTVTKTGYQQLTTDILLTSGQSLTYTANLLPETTTGGSIAITSVPSGAAVYLDNVPRGTTQTTLTGVSEGYHTLKLAKTGYKDYTVPVEVKNGATTPVTAPLELATLSPTTGSIAASSIPTGAAVYLDNVPRGTTPLTIPGVTAASHTVKLTLAGYQDVTRTVEVVAGETAPVSVTLQAVSSGTGSISVESVPSAATVFLDGVNKGMTPATLSAVPAGSHTLKLSRSGYQDRSLQVTVTAGKTTPIALTLPAGGNGDTPTDDTGTLVVVSSPAGASVTLDGQAKGTTPATLTGLFKGTHILTLTMDGYGNHTETVTVEAGETRQVSVIMEKSGGIIPGMGIPGFGAAAGLLAAGLIVLLAAGKRY